MVAAAEFLEYPVEGVQDRRAPARRDLSPEADAAGDGTSDGSGLGAPPDGVGLPVNPIMSACSVRVTCSIVMPYTVQSNTSSLLQAYRNAYQSDPEALNLPQKHALIILRRPLLLLSECPSRATSMPFGSTGLASDTAGVRPDTRPFLLELVSLGHCAKRSPEAKGPTIENIGFATRSVMKYEHRLTSKLWPGRPRRDRPEDRGRGV